MMSRSLQPSHPVTESYYRQYRCATGDPLSCEQCYPQPFQETASHYCQTCNFPAILTEQAQIRGMQAIYEVETWLGKRGQGRLYQGHQLPEEQPVIIKEYLLPTRVFNEDSRKERKRAFTRLAGLSLADGRSQDFRLVTPHEAIADQTEERCYLITRGSVNAYPTLGSVLKTCGSMTGQQVRRVLEQVLQTLDFLHQQKFRFPNGQVKLGVAHGNLSLESLLIRNGKASPQTYFFNPSTEPIAEEAGWHEDFLIYLCDLGIWESLFLPPVIPVPEPTIADDLRAVGQIGIYLLAGSSTDSTTGELLDPATLHSFSTISPAFKDYLMRLLGLSFPFATADIARQALLRLPPEATAVNPNTGLWLERDDRIEKPTFLWKRALWLLLFLLSGGLLLWWLSALLKPSVSVSTDIADKSLCCMSDLSGIPAGKFTYTAAKTGTWSYTLLQPNMVEAGKTLETVLQERQPKLQLTYKPTETIEAAIANVRSQQAAFLVTSSLDQVTAELDSQEIAYDGLSVFVAFSYALRENSLPRFLNGKITFAQLRQLYTGKIKNWQELGGPNLPVKLYIPVEAEAVHFFEQRVLANSENIAQFRSLVATGEITTQPSFSTFRQIIRDFEQNQVGSIAFGPISQVFGQCSVYPLAVVDQTGTAFQALVEDNGNPITPATNLCAAKGSYDRDINLFQSKRYPLGYSLAIVSLKDNRQQSAGQKFAEILRTEEGQRLLNKTGLIPLQPLPKNPLHNNL